MSTNGDEEALVWKDVWEEEGSTERDSSLFSKDYNDIIIFADDGHGGVVGNPTGANGNSHGNPNGTVIRNLDENIDGSYKDSNDRIDGGSIVATPDEKFDESSDGERAAKAPPQYNTYEPIAHDVTESRTWNETAPRFASYTNGIAGNKFPRDCYSFLALHGPFTTKQKRNFFLFGLLPFLFQVVFLMLLLWSVMDQKRGTVGETDNPDSEHDGTRGFFAKFIPSNASPIVRCTQVVSIAAYMVFPDSSLKDVVRAVQMFPRPSEIQVGDPVGCMRFSCLVRGLQGMLAIFAALLLVITSDTVVDIILNFTAVNFISNLDEAAFLLALSGEFGPVLKAEAERIVNEDLPTCMYKAAKHVYYRIVVGFISLLFFGMLISVIVAQEDKHLWVTRILRVQFQEGTGLGEYSGCFEISDNSIFFQRYLYNSYGNSMSNSSFGYCREDRRWILFQGNEDINDPCDISKDMELARSSKTDAFDISTLFDESWVSSSNTPLDMYFFEGGEEKDLYCNLSLDDGICDPSFNEPGYQYDGGDCCAATCTQSNCGKGGLTSAFGSSNVSAAGFEYCKDPDMVPITVYLNDIVSSRDPQFAVFDYEKPWDTMQMNESAWRNVKPVNPYFSLDCNDRNVLTVYIEESMVNNSETVMVEDGSSCTVVVRNTTTYQSPNPEIDDPIWFVNFTLFHGENDGVRILTQHSSTVEVSNFKRVPDCYFRKLEKHIDLDSIYTSSASPNKAIDWLLADTTGNSQCEDDDFIERYSLTNMFFAMSDELKFLNNGKQCTWPSVICSEGKVETINLGGGSLRGRLPSEIGLLQNLKKLELDNNRISSIPSEIGTLQSLEELDFYDNKISEIPSEIGMLGNLRRLDLYKNRISKIPSEIGMLENLQELDLYNNNIKVFPSEIGQMTSLRRLDLYLNELTSMPSEIGLLTGLQEARFCSFSFIDISNLAELPCIGQEETSVVPSTSFPTDASTATLAPTTFGGAIYEPTFEPTFIPTAQFTTRYTATLAPTTFGGAIYEPIFEPTFTPTAQFTAR